MSFTKYRRYRLKAFDVGQLEQALLRAFQLAGSSPTDTIHCHLGERLPGGAEHSRDISLEDVETICEIKDKVLIASLRLEGGWNKIQITLLSMETDSLVTRVDSPDGTVLEPALDILAETLKLQVPPPSSKPRDGRLLFFLSYRFEAKSRSVAETLQRFLRLLDVYVITGEEYEPRSISEKIKARLELPLDAVVVLVIDNESFWTRDEIAIAKGRGIPVVPLVASGTEFAPGVFGDLEWIRFELDHIEQTFISLLEAMRYIRLRSASSE